MEILISVQQAVEAKRLLCQNRVKRIRLEEYWLWMEQQMGIKECRGFREIHVGTYLHQCCFQFLGDI